MPGLNFEGLPDNLKNTSFPFPYNDFDYLSKLINKKKIGIIKMEVMRNIKPKDNFLKKVRNLANKYKCVLIFDECTTGFRETYGGIHKKYKVNPDIVIFGKAIGNGYAITTVLGKKKIMEQASNSFISSTFWSERSGPTAALETIRLMKKIKSWKIIQKKGKKIKKIWKELALKHSLDINISELDSICSFQFNSIYHNFFKSFLTYQMLNYGFLASNIVMISTSHTDNIIKKYIKKYLN